MTLAQWLILPVVINVALAFFLVRQVRNRRIAAFKSGEVRLEDIALDSSRWPESPRKFANNYQNQFELPVLFYALVPLLLIMNLVDVVEVVLAWSFVSSRLFHCYVHTGANDVRQRLLVFATGVYILMAMWAWFALRLFVIG